MWSNEGLLHHEHDDVLDVPPGSIELLGGRIAACGFGAGDG